MTREDMTRGEAIAFGNRVIDLGFRDETQAFCEMAIKALEQEPKYRKEAKRWKNKALGQKQVLDKISEEIERQEKWLMSARYSEYNVDIAFSSIKSVLAESEEV